MIDTLDAQRAAAELGIPAAAIYDWKHRGRIHPAGYVRGVGRGGRVPIYRLAELRPLAEQYLERLARRADSGGAGPPVADDAR